MKRRYLIVLAAAGAALTASTAFAAGINPPAAPALSPQAVSCLTIPVRMGGGHMAGGRFSGGYHGGARMGGSFSHGMHMRHGGHHGFSGRRHHHGRFIFYGAGLGLYPWYYDDDNGCYWSCRNDHGPRYCRAYCAD
jgi:hypothetical protein